jgi:serine/threonine protein kinase
VRRDGAAGATTGPVEGTLHYMPPEVLAGGAPDARADLYALGVVMYQMLTGHLPYEAMDLEELYYRQLNEEPLAARAHRPELPARLDAVLTRALAREPSRRYPDAATLRGDLEELRA